MLAAALGLALAATVAAATARAAETESVTFEASMSLTATTRWSVFRESDADDTCGIGERHVGVQTVSLRTARPTLLRLTTSGDRYVVRATLIRGLRGVVTQTARATARSDDAATCAQETVDCTPRRSLVRKGTVRVATRGRALVLDRLRHTRVPRSVRCALGRPFAIPAVELDTRGGGNIALRAGNTVFVARGTATRPHALDATSTGAVRTRVAWTLTLRRR